MHKLFKRLLLNLEPSQSTQVRPRSMVLPGERGSAGWKTLEGAESRLYPSCPQPTTAAQASRFSAGAEQIPEFPGGSQLLRGTGSATPRPAPPPLQRSLVWKTGAERTPPDSVLRQLKRRTVERVETEKEGGARKPGSEGRRRISTSGACCALEEFCPGGGCGGRGERRGV